MSHKQIGIQKGNCYTWETQNTIVASRMLSLKNVVMLEHNTVVPEVSGPPPLPHHIKHTLSFANTKPSPKFPSTNFPFYLSTIQWYLWLAASPPSQPPYQADPVFSKHQPILGFLQ